MHFIYFEMHGLVCSDLAEQGYSIVLLSLLFVCTGLSLTQDGEHIQVLNIIIIIIIIIILLFAGSH